MAGGIGSRLWPVSTPSVPKQFIDILGVGRTLLQMTVERFIPVCKMENFWVVTSEKYVDMVHDQLPDIPEEHILAEPEARNTAPCIAYACWKISSVNPESNIVVTPADALVLNTSKFTEVMKRALSYTESHDSIVTVGIVPSRPETGYGYICASEISEENIVKVSSFKEKPDLPTAKYYIGEGCYFWNAGIFVWNACTISSQFRRFAPQIASVMDEMSVYFGTETEQEAVRKLFPSCEKISIDYAIMEKSDDIYVISADLGWSDLGSWGSVGSYMHKDSEGNAIVGRDVRMFGSKNCIVHDDSDEMVVIDGLDGYIVAHKGNRLLICRISEEQKIKDYSAK